MSEQQRESTGKTVDEAVREALLRMGLRREEVDVTVIKEARSGILGLGRRDAVVRVVKKSSTSKQPRGRRRPETERRSEEKREAEPDARSSRRSGGRSPERSDGSPAGRGRPDAQSAKGDPRRRGERGPRGGKRGAQGGALEEEKPGGSPQGRNDRPDRSMMEERKTASTAGPRAEADPARSADGEGRRRRRPRRRKKEGAQSPDNDTMALDAAAPDLGGMSPGDDGPDESRVGDNELFGAAEVGKAPTSVQANAPAANGTELPDRGIDAEAPAQEEARDDGRGLALGVVARSRCEPWTAVEAAQAAEFLQKVATELMIKSGFPCRVQVQEGEYHQVKMVVDDRSAGILIGRYGNTVDAIEHLVEKIASKAAGERVRMNLDINNYRLRCEDHLAQHARAAAAEARETGRPVGMQPAGGRERRIVHLYIQETGDLATYTEAGPDGKYVVVCRPDQIPEEHRKGEDDASEPHNATDDAPDIEINAVIDVGAGAAGEPSEANRREGGD